MGIVCKNQRKRAARKKLLGKNLEGGVESTPPYTVGLRDTEANIMEKVCIDVQTEPALLETDGQDIRPDISARGIWNRYEKTFFDVKVIHPTADSHMAKPLGRLYSEGEAEKKRKYNERIINTEHASFTPLVF